MNFADLSFSDQGAGRWRVESAGDRAAHLKTRQAETRTASSTHGRGDHRDNDCRTSAKRSAMTMAGMPITRMIGVQLHRDVRHRWAMIGMGVHEVG